MVANGTSNDITVSLWNGQGGWNTTTYTALPGIADVAVGFVGSDQYGDIIAVGTPGLVVLAGIAGGGFAQPQTWPAGTMASKLITGDFKATEFAVSYVADNLVILRYAEYASRVIRIVGCLKKRLGAFEPELRQLHIQPSGIEVSERLEHLRGILTGVPSY